MVETFLYILSTFLVTVLASIYLYKKWRWSYWSRRGLITYFPRKFMDFGTQHNPSYFYFKKRGLKHGGTYLFFHPHYIPVDLDIIKRILISDFDSFVNRGLFEVKPKEGDLNAHLFNLTDQHWKNMRSKLSPTFTSGKLKMMFQTLADTTSDLEEIFQDYADSKQCFEMKDVMARFTTDVIVSTAFGIESNSIKNPDSDFRKFGKAIMENVDAKTIPIFLISSLPKFIRFFLFKLLQKMKPVHKDGDFNHHDFIKSTVKATVDYREKNNIKRNDFMHLLLLLKNKGTVEEGQNMTMKPEKESVGNLTLGEIAAQCMLFFIGGYDTSSTIITYALYQLAKNPEIQEKLREEIHEALAENDGKMSYDIIHKMSYLDKVVNETLRMHPPVRSLSRQCKQDYQVPGTNFTLSKNEMVFICTEAIHYDPNIYPEPEKFDPDRFSLENKAKMHSVQFLPFGEGPRMCIGSRFGLMQTKVGLTSVLNKFRVSLNSKTKQPLLEKKSFLTNSVQGGMWFNVEVL